MPSGKQHDLITLWCLPWVCLVSRLMTQSWGYTLLITGGFLFGGLMFGPDLDIRSVQSKRWGWLQWIWYPYRQGLRHRSWLSHGFLAGTCLRLLYLCGWMLLGALFVLEISNNTGRTSITWGELKQSLYAIVIQFWREGLAFGIGIELGAMSHSISDWSVSSWKRQRRSRRKKKPRR